MLEMSPEGAERHRRHLSMLLERNPLRFLMPPARRAELLSAAALGDLSLEKLENVLAMLETVARRNLRLLGQLVEVKDLEQIRLMRREKYAWAVEAPIEMPIDHRFCDVLTRPAAESVAAQLEAGVTIFRALDQVARDLEQVQEWARSKRRFRPRSAA